MSTIRTAIIAAALVGLAACSADREPGELFGPTEAGVLVVDALLIVGEPLPELFLRRTADPGAVYEAAAQGVLVAEVRIRHGAGEVVYAPDPDSAGRFLPVGEVPRVAPQSDYELDVRVGDERLTARTRTPGPLRVREAVVLDEESLVVRQRFTLYDGVTDVFAEQDNWVRYLDGLLEVRVDSAAGAAGYQLSLFNLEPESDFVVDADFLEEDDYEDFERQGSSPPLDTADGRVRLPWFSVAFAGRHVWRTYALDRNWYDFARTDPGTGGGPFGQLAGDGFQRPLFHVQGGIGLFGSAAVDSVGFIVLPSNHP